MLKVHILYSVLQVLLCNLFEGLIASDFWEVGADENVNIYVIFLILLPLQFSKLSDDNRILSVWGQLLPNWVK